MFLLSISSTSYLHWYLWLLAQWISNTETEWRYCKKILSVVVILFIDGIRQFLMAVPLVPVSFIWGRSFVVSWYCYSLLPAALRRRMPSESVVGLTLNLRCAAVSACRKRAAVALESSEWNFPSLGFIICARVLCVSVFLGFDFYSNSKLNFFN